MRRVRVRSTQVGNLRRRNQASECKRGKAMLHKFIECWEKGVWWEIVLRNPWWVFYTWSCELSVAKDWNQRCKVQPIGQKVRKYNQEGWCVQWKSQCPVLLVRLWTEIACWEQEDQWWWCHEKNYSRLELEQRLMTWSCLRSAVGPSMLELLDSLLQPREVLSHSAGSSSLRSSSVYWAPSALEIGPSIVALAQVLPTSMTPCWRLYAGSGFLINLSVGHIV